MGIIRKTMSVSTGGVVSFRNNRERVAKAQKKSAKAQQSQAEAQHAQAYAAQRHAAAAEVQAQALWAATTRPPAPPPPPVPALSAVSVADELLKLQSLREAGALTDAEFATAKARLLGATAPTAGIAPHPTVPPPPTRPQP